MGCLKFLVGGIVFLSCVCSWGREVTDTIESVNKDKVYITYEIRENNGHFDIYFLNSRKLLGPIYKKKYQKLDEIAVLFFDRIGNYNDGLKFEGINVETYMIPKELKYKRSKDGYFLMHDKPVLSVELEDGDSANISFPFYLAHYEGKRSYKVFSRCENLVIKLSKKKPVSTSNGTSVQMVSQTVTTQEEVEEALSEEVEASILVKKILELLRKQDEYPFPDDLKRAYDDLFDKKFRISDNKIILEIEDVLEAYESKEDSLKAIAKAEAKEKEKEDSLRAAAEQARQDSITVAAQQQAEKDSKRNLWLIIGGAILAVLGFIGNQVSQHFRNAKNQRNILAMQEDMRKKAENEAKRRARNMAQSQINRVREETRQGTRNAINAGINKIKQKGKGNKSISI